MINLIKYRVLFYGLLLLLVLNSCRKESGDHPSKSYVLTTTPVLRQVATAYLQGSDLEVKSLSLPAGQCVHSYQLTPQEMQNFCQARWVLANGMGLEPFLTKVRSQCPHVPVFFWLGDDSTDRAETSHHHHEHAESASDHAPHHHHHHDHHGEDPHQWLDLQALKQLRMHLVEKLSPLISAAEQDSLRARDQIFSKREDSLAHWIALQSFPSQKVVVLHGALGHFAESLGWQVLSVLEHGENISLNPQQLSQLINAANQGEIDYWLADSASLYRTLPMLQKETSVPALVLLSDVDDQYPDPWALIGENLRRIHLGLSQGESHE